MCIRDRYHGTGDNTLSLQGPASTITTKDRLCLINTIWLDKQFGGESNHQSINRPAGTILTNDKHCKVSVVPSPKVQCKWLFNHNYGNIGSIIENPCPTLLASRKHFYILNPQYSSKMEGVIVIDENEGETINSCLLYTSDA